MKILVLAESLRINETSSGIGRSKFIKALSEIHEVTCLYENSVSYPITWLDGVHLVPVNYVERQNNFFDSIPKLRGLYTYLNGFNREFSSRVRDWVDSIYNTLKENEFDIIFCLGSGASFAPHYAMIDIKTHLPWIANFHDPYPMSLYPDPYRKKETIVYKKQKAYTQQIISKASFVSFPSLYLKNLMSNYYKGIESKCVILPHIGIEFDKLPENYYDQEVVLDSSKFNLLHAGSLLGPRKVKFLFSAFEKFVSKNKERRELAILTVIGKVAREHSNLKKENHDLSQNINIITDRVSYKRSLELLENTSVGLVIEADADFSPFMPGKLADLLFNEIPVFALTPLKSETNRILGEDYPYKSEVNDEEKILKILEILWNEWKFKKIKSINFKQYKEYISEAEFNKQINKLINVYNS